MSSDDCFFYYYAPGGCQVANCKYRHEASAKGNEERCVEWLVTRNCTQRNCRYRHMKENESVSESWQQAMQILTKKREKVNVSGFVDRRSSGETCRRGAVTAALKKNRSEIPCIHEKKDSGCTKEDCTYKHSGREKPGANDTSDAAGDMSGKSEVFICRLCDVKCTSVEVLTAHIQGKKHQGKLQLQQGAQQQQQQQQPTATRIFFSTKQQTSNSNNSNSSNRPSAVDKAKIKKKQQQQQTDQRKKRSSSAHVNSRIPTTGDSSQGLQSPPPPPLMDVPPPPYSVHPLHNHSSSSISDNNGARPKLQRNSATASCNSVGVFWDMDNCALKRGMSSVAFVKKVRDQFLKGKVEVLFLAAMLDNKRPDNTAKVLQELGVGIESSKDMLRQKMRSFADLQQQKERCTILLVSGDAEFAPDLHNFRHIRNHEVLLMHNPQAKESLKSLANRCFSFQGFIKDIPVEEDLIKPGGGARKSERNILLFWDLQSCRPPNNVSVIDVVAKLRDTFFGSEQRSREVGFGATGIDRADERQTLRELGLELGEGDDLLRQMLLQQRPKSLSLLVVVSDNVGLIGEIRRLRYEERVEVVLIHSVNARETLLATVGKSCCWKFEDFVEELKQKRDKRATYEEAKASKDRKGVVLMLLDKLLDI